MYYFTYLSLRPRLVGTCIACTLPLQISQNTAPPSFRSEMHGSRPRRICSSCLKTRLSTCTCVLIPNGPSSYGSSQPHSKSGAAERGLARPTCARVEDAIIPIAFDKTDLRLSLQSSSHPSGEQVPSCTSYIGIADPPRVRTFQNLRHCLGPHHHVPPPE
jgi:hypothetical protein